MAVAAKGTRLSIHQLFLFYSAFYFFFAGEAELNILAFISFLF